MDIREQLRHDHAKALAELDGVAREGDPGRGHARLARLRHAWMIHALAEESVVYRSVEGATGERADERFVEHELVENLFEKLVRTRHGTFEWQARVKVLRELMSHHIGTEEGRLFADLDERFSADELVALGEQFVLASDKLALLERVKNAARSSSRAPRSRPRAAIQEIRPEAARARPAPRVPPSRAPARRKRAALRSPV
jgi:hypothetical protein